MTTDELIRALRICTGQIENHDPNNCCEGCPFDPIGPCINALMTKAADRLEELDERVAIMEEGQSAQWVEEPDRVNHWHCSRCGRTEGMTHRAMRYCPGCGAIMEEGNE